MADALIGFINASTPAPAAASACGSASNDNGVIAVAKYRRGQSYEFTFIYHGCPTSTIFGLGPPRTFAGHPAGFLVDAANSFSPPDFPGEAPAPDLFGESAMVATRAAQRAGYSLRFTAEQTYDGEPFGSILFQIPPPGSWATGVHTILLTLASRPEPACTSADLAVKFFMGGPETADDVGSLGFWNISDDPCTLVGPVLIVGVNAAGSPDTQEVTAEVPAGLVLTPDGPPVTDVQDQVPPTEVVAAMDLFANYRDDATAPNGECVDRWSPAAFRIVLAGSAVTVANSGGYLSATSSLFSKGLLTCRGDLGVSSVNVE